MMAQETDRTFLPMCANIHKQGLGVCQKPFLFEMCWVSIKSIRSRILKVLARIGAPQKVIDHTIPLVTTHMRHAGVEKVSRRMVRNLVKALGPCSLSEWAELVKADHAARPPRPAITPKIVQDILEFELTEETKCPLMGRHLIEMGFKPGPLFGKLLKQAETAFLDGEITTIQEGKEFIRRVCDSS